jgi:hypothetical protein
LPPAALSAAQPATLLAHLTLACLESPPKDDS